MKYTFFVSAVFVCLFSASGLFPQEHTALLPATQIAASAIGNSAALADGFNTLADPDADTQTQIAARVFAQERAAVDGFRKLTPVVETYIQTEKPDPQMGIIPKSDFYFLGLGDLSDKLKVRSITPSTKQRSLMWEFEPAGFLQMIFLDRYQFDKDHYKLTYRNREFLGEVRCYIFDVEPLPNAHGWRFVGRIWVEDQDDFIVRINGTYEPERRFSLRHFDDGFYLHFETWRLNVGPHSWLPATVYSQQLKPSLTYPGPLYKSLTHLWGYKLSPRSREEELGRVLVEAPGVQDQDAQHDRSPLDQQREWRQLAEDNVMDVLTRDGLVAPEGDVEKVLNTIVNNLDVTNNLPTEKLHCRVLMTTNLEMFSMQNVIVLSRGLIDVVPDEATLASLLAFEVADALVPKPAQDQYGFSDILRLKPTEVVQRLSFEDNPVEAEANSRRAVAFLQKSPYADKLANVGLFLSELQSQRNTLRELIKPHLGNAIYFESELLKAAPPLQPLNQQQIVALPMGSRIKINPWDDGLGLMKLQTPALNSPREKMPLEITPVKPYLTRYVASPKDEEHSNVPVSPAQKGESTPRD